MARATDPFIDSDKSNHTNRRFSVAWVLLFALLMVKAVLIFSIPVSNQYNGDALDYGTKASHLVTHGTFKRVTAPTVPGDIAGQYSDFRPPGFPVIVAALMWIGGQTPSKVNASTSILNFTLDAIVCTMLLGFALQVSPRRSHQLFAAAIIGLQPWTSSFVTATYPDTVVTFLAVAGVAALTRYIGANSRKGEVWAMLAGSLALSAGSLVRPEMILFPPAMTAAAWYLKHRSRRAACPVGVMAMVAALPLLVAIALNVGYRWTVENKVAIYGEFQAQTPGLVKWVQTWTGTGKAKEDILWGPFQISQEEFEKLDEGIFSSAEEKKQLAEIATKVRERGYMTKDEDRIFGRIAEKKISEKPLNYYLFVRLYNAGHYWINLSSANYLLANQIKLPRSASKAVTGFFFGFKILVLSFAVWGFGLALRQVFVMDNNKNTNTDFVIFLVLGLLFVLIRTMVFSFYANAIEFRYVLPAWPFVVSAGIYGLLVVIGKVRQ